MKNKTTHTPGPWRIGKNPQYVIAGDDSVTRTHSTVLGEAVAEANARLIAAAPDLLAALEAIQAGFMDGSIKWNATRQSAQSPYHPANTAMSAALAKAEGK